ncbi:uncharacterized protein LOC125669025 [Ostrea edulis]|uniref:uncharacterized protein LOC125669025 n=1 Tax=Ostrea edulis TaxID=37623 RepID=UPI0024AF385C|nr:uncharacterized protein LOC125669025 [Ostrea edulis]
MSKKNISNSLYNLQRKHKSLSTKVIQYFKKSFSYMLSQNQGNPCEIERGLSALSLHPFGNHTECSVTWCQHKENATKKYSSLPYGRPLENKELQEDIALVFNRLKKHNLKLSRFGSTQPNESFNKTVASKTPKTHLYSRSIGYRVAASVAKKNMGQGYLIQLNKKLGLSPGAYTGKLALSKDTQARRKKALALTKQAKKRRLQLKANRKQSTAVMETREEENYKSEIAFDEIDITAIPEPIIKAALQPATFSSNTPLVFFDLEATGLARDSHITQLAAVCGEEKFSTYVFPRIHITAKASEITGIEIVNEKMFSKNVEVNPLKISAGIDALLNFVSKFQTKVILIGHNIKSYDCHLLLNALESCKKKKKDFSPCIAGFVDTKILFKIYDGTLNCYSRESLFKHFVSSKYNAHDAIEDVLALQKLIGHLDIDVSNCIFSNASFTFLNALESCRYSSEVRKNIPTLNHLINEKVVSKGMASKIAGSGLNFRCLQLAYRRDPHDGIQNLLSEKVRNGVRVTKSQKVIFL